MSLPPSHQFKQDCMEIWETYVSRFPWQWTTVHTFEPGIKYFAARKRFKKWHCRLLDEEKLRVGCYVMSSSKKGSLHFHCLLLGRNRYGKTLLDCDCRKWRDVWWTTNQTVAKVEPITDFYGACSYQALQYLGFKSDYAAPEPFDLGLLQKVMQLKNDGLDFLENL